MDTLTSLSNDDLLHAYVQRMSLLELVGERIVELPAKVQYGDGPMFELPSGKLLREEIMRRMRNKTADGNR